MTARRNISTNYTLQLQADANYGTVELAGSKETVSLVFANGSTAPINPKADTWIVIHGWEGSPSMYRGLSSALQSKRTQVLALDWSGPASSDLLTAFAWASPVGQFAADTLTRWGLPTSRINVVGHSLGGLVAGALAANVDGGVNRVVALDPATDPFAWTVDYSADSQFSLAFIGSSFSTSAAAATADESFKIDVGDFTSIFSHMAVVDLFTSIVTSNKTATPDPISRLLAFDRLTPTADQPWKTDAYSDDFEGTIVGRQSRQHLVPRHAQVRLRDIGEDRNGQSIGHLKRKRQRPRPPSEAEASAPASRAGTAPRARIRRLSRNRPRPHPPSEAEVSAPAYPAGTAPAPASAV